MFYLYTLYIDFIFIFLVSGIRLCSWLPSNHLKRKIVENLLTEYYQYLRILRNKSQNVRITHNINKKISSSFEVFLK